ncbi:MAG TPA: hypothetical protein VIG33_12060 [Pseudobdellovibrionaceae bacterium]
MFKLYVAIVASVFSLNAFAFSPSGNFPKGPDAVLTPGEVCDHPDAHRYPEGIAYCNRNVSSDLKRAIFVNYDQLGFRTTQMQRMDFKIDHYIPLCMGGGNDIKNLWPQHKSIYAVTDPLEPLLCDKMAAGVLTQKKAIEYITYGKNHLDEIPHIISEVNNL